MCMHPQYCERRMEEKGKEGTVASPSPLTGDFSLSLSPVSTHFSQQQRQKNKQHGLMNYFGIPPKSPVFKALRIWSQILTPTHSLCTTETRWSTSLASFWYATSYAPANLLESILECYRLLRKAPLMAREASLPYQPPNPMVDPLSWHLYSAEHERFSDSHGISELRVQLNHRHLFYPHSSLPTCRTHSWCWP